jgi:O-antigen/teichoic acid export membrane protein
MGNQPSISKNYIYNTLLTVLNIIFPLITFPYVARLLEPDGIGRVNYAQSIVGYFILLASVGIPAYGIKEVSKVRGDRDKLNKVFSELFILSTIFTLVSTLAYIVLFMFIDKMKNDSLLYIILGGNLILNIFAIDWLYSGIENYRYITIRSIVFKVVSFGLIFILIHQKSDYLFYALIFVIAISGANILNIINSRRYVSFSFRNLDLRRHLKPVFLLFFGGIIASVYKTLDTILLGGMQGDAAVGFYAINGKIVAMSMALIMSLSNVLIPRLSFYLNNRMQKEYNELASRSLNFIYFLSFPAIVLLTSFSYELLFVFGGDKFLAASLALKFLSPIVLLTPLSAFFVFHVLLPNNQERKMMLATLAGAVVNFTLNMIFIPMFSFNATCAAMSLSEASFVITLYILSRKYLSIPLFSRGSINYLIGAAGMLGIIFVFRLFISNTLLLFILGTAISSAFYILLLLLIKDEFIYKIIGKGKSMLLKILRITPKTKD